MAGTCKVTLIGNVVNDPTITTTKNTGAPRCTFRMAVNWKDQEGNEVSDFYSISMVGAVVNVVEKYVKKGMQQLTVFGTLTHRPYTDKEGYAAISNDVYANDLVLPPKNGNGNGHGEEAPTRRPAAAPQQQAAPAAPTDPDEDLDWEPPQREPVRPARNVDAEGNSRPARPAAPPAARPPAPPVAKPAVIKTASQAKAIADRVRAAKEGSDAPAPPPAARPVRPTRPTIAETAEEDLPF